MKERIHYWDNLKGFLILLVVSGHLIEKLPDGRFSGLYKMIYLFHMPLFVFCSGFLARYDPQKILMRLLVPYAALQIVSCIGNGQPIQLLTPVWILWYLPALAIWQITIPFLDLCPARVRPLMILGWIVAGCLAGFDSEIGYHGTFSRIIVFYPYFVAGYCARQHARLLPESRLPGRVLSAKASLAMRVLSIVVLSAVVGRFLAEAPGVAPEWLYEGAGYAATGSTYLFRALRYVVAAAVGLAVMMWIPRRRNSMGRWGQSTFAIYLSHIVLVPIAENLPKIAPDPRLQHIICIALAAVYCSIVSLLVGRYRSIQRFRKSSAGGN